MQKSIADYPKVGRKSQQPPGGAIFFTPASRWQTLTRTDSYLEKFQEKIEVKKNAEERWA